MKLSWTSRLVAAAGRKRGPLLTAAVYLLGGRFFTRSFYKAQGNLAPWKDEPFGYMSLSFDVDYPQDAENLGRVCELLDKIGLRAGFAVIGSLVEQYPAEHRILIEAGHEIINHTYSHPHNEPFEELSPQARKQQMERCHFVCEDLLYLLIPSERYSKIWTEV